MPGLTKDDLMHEWLEKDAVSLDLTTEQIIEELVKDSEIMLRFIKQKNLEGRFRLFLMNESNQIDQSESEVNVVTFTGLKLMKLHERLDTEQMSIWRVPNGLIYRFWDNEKQDHYPNAVFVPLNCE